MRRLPARHRARTRGARPPAGRRPAPAHCVGPWGWAPPSRSLRPRPPARESHSSAPTTDTPPCHRARRCRPDRPLSPSGRAAYRRRHAPASSGSRCASGVRDRGARALRPLAARRVVPRARIAARAATRRAGSRVRPPPPLARHPGARCDAAPRRRHACARRPRCRPPCLRSHDRSHPTTAAHVAVARRNRWRWSPAARCAPPSLAIPHAARSGTRLGRCPAVHGATLHTAASASITGRSAWRLSFKEAGLTISRALMSMISSTSTS